MPITNTVLNKTQFEYLATNITDQYNYIGGAGTIAQTGLHYVVLLQDDAPEVDLVNPFADQVSRVETLNSYGYFTSIVSALCFHAANRNDPTSVDTPSEKLNQYFSDYGVTVSSTFAAIAAAAGFIIDPVYIV